MRLAPRVATWLCAAGAGLVLLLVGSVLLALALVGVFARSGSAWTTEVTIAGIPLTLSVPGMVRLATLPGVAHALDGQSFDTRLGRVNVARDGAALRVSCAPCRIRHPDLAATPLKIRSIVLVIARDGDALDGRVTVDRMALAFNGRIRNDGIDVAWRLPSTELHTLVRALADAVPEASFARIEGRIAAHGSIALPSRRSTVQWNAEALEVGGLGTEHLQYGWFRFACATRDGMAQLTVTGDGEKPWAALDSLGPYLAAAVIAAEDPRFHQHPGYDEEALAEILADIEDGRPRRGASTITQQLARTLFTGGDKTAVRKIREWLYAIEMERTLGKSRILELYLNTVDWGPGACGAKAAARLYFNKPPARLTAIEAAWLASVLRNPHVAWQQQFVPRHAERARATQVLMQMRDWPRRERQRLAAQPLSFAQPSKARREFGARPLVAQRTPALDIRPSLQATPSSTPAR